MTEPFSMKKWRKQEAQANRPIIAWDGEGINRWEQDGMVFQDYAMLSNSLGERMIANPRESLERVKVLEWMIDVQARNPNAIHVVFGGNYDFNMILRGNAPAMFEEMEELKASEEMRVGSYRVKAMWGRVLEVTGKGQCFKLFDVLPFFQTPFIKACDSYLGTDWPGREVIIKMKAERTSFEYDEMDKINEYNDYELQSLVLLVEELRRRLFSAGLRITNWYGPGAIAAFIYKQEQIKLCMDQEHTISDPDFGHAVRAAYAGGRFEVIKTGYNINQPVYEYDINSAYPYAMTKLPDLKTGRWEYVENDPGDKEFALYHLSYEANGAEATDQWDTPFPLFHRSRQSLIFYPPVVSGWFWSPEVSMARKYVAKWGGSIIIDKAYVYHSDNTKPFQFVAKMYDDRQRLKAEGSGAQIGLKLGLNSLYGKMAQQVGWTEEKLPPFHQLEWAGYVTSHCRAQIMTAVMEKPENVIAFATDAVFVTEPLNVPINNELGGWEPTVFTNMSMLQSGIYFGEVDGQFVNRSRGIRPENFDREKILEDLRSGITTLTVPSIRFIGLAAALQRKTQMWCCWNYQTAEIALLLTAPSKRVHARPNTSGDSDKQWLVCPLCEPDYLYTEGFWHLSHVPPLVREENKEHQVEWVMKDEFSDDIIHERESEYHILEYMD